MVIHPYKAMAKSFGITLHTNPGASINRNVVTDHKGKGAFFGEVNESKWT